MRRGTMMSDLEYGIEGERRASYPGEELYVMGTHVLEVRNRLAQLLTWATSMTIISQGNIVNVQSCLNDILLRLEALDGREGHVDRFKPVGGSPDLIP